MQKSPTFDLDSILGTASNLKYRRALKAEIANEFRAPSEEFVRMFASRVYPGRLTSSVRDEFAALTQGACNEFIRDRVNNRLKSAFETDRTDEAPETDTTTTEVAAENGGTNDGIETTPAEWSAYRIIQAIGAKMADPERITIRDAKSYCAILFDDNNRRPICRLHFGAKKNRLTIFEPENEHRIDLEKITDIYKYTEQVGKAVGQYVDGVIGTNRV